MNNPIKSFGATFLVVILLTGCGSTTAPSSRPSTQPPAAETLSLTVEEYAIVDDSVDKPTHFEFMDRVDPKIKAKRKAIRESSFKPDVARMNQTLERFGYMLRVQDQPGAPATEDAGYSLYRGEERILTDIWRWNMSPVYVNASGTDWFFGAYTEPTGSVVIRAGEI